MKTNKTSRPSEKHLAGQVDEEARVRARQVLGLPRTQRQHRLGSGRRLEHLARQGHRSRRAVVRWCAERGVKWKALLLVGGFLSAFLFDQSRAQTEGQLLS